MSSLSHTLKANFQYRHRNIYHDKLQDYGQFVFRDREAEQFAGKWNRQVFERDAPIAVEIGPGYGHFMLEYCEQHPTTNFIGIDYRFKRSFQLAKKIKKRELNNIRYLRARGERLHFIFGPKEVDQVFFFFPDPWPKTRHHKKRLLRPPFLDSIDTVLKPGGEFFIKTDHDEYAQWMARHLQDDPRWQMELFTRDLRAEYPEHFLSSYKTKFENIFLAQGVPIKAFALRKAKACHE